MTFAAHCGILESNTERQVLHMASVPMASDNQIRRINKRLEGIASSIGTTNKLYNDITNLIMSMNLGTSKKNYIRQNGKIALKRGKTSTLTLAAATAIETYINTHKLTDYKKEIRKYAKETGRTAKTVHDYKSLAKEMYDLGTDYDEALQYLYHLRTKPGYSKLMAELKHKGRVLSYGEMKTNLDKIENFISGNGGRQVVSPFDT